MPARTAVVFARCFVASAMFFVRAKEAVEPAEQTFHRGSRGHRGHRAEQMAAAPHISSLGGLRRHSGLHCLA